LDNLNDYYEVSLKGDRLDRLKGEGFEFLEADIVDDAAVRDLFGRHGFKRVVHLAAQAGVRHSIDHPAAYVQSNVVGFLNVLEGCRAVGAEHLVYASSSSVYGMNATMPFSTHGGAAHPVSLYGATKMANEAMAHSYSHLYGLPTTGLRFFTVYGPWGRPDMAPMLFARAIADGTPIKVFNEGRMLRDFTYVDDVVAGLLAVLDRPPVADPAWSAERADPATSRAPYRLYNVGNHEPVALLRFIEVMEAAMGRPALKTMLPMQPGDVLATYADVEDLARDAGFRPTTPIETGVERFAAWFRDYYGLG
ncbi:NAD-dependent epimerase/dehydratase family protein, partial [bacterium]